LDEDIVALVEKARRIDREELEKLPAAYRYQFARVRDDME